MSTARSARSAPNRPRPKHVLDDHAAPINRWIEPAFLLGHRHDALGEYDTAIASSQTGIATRCSLYQTSRERWRNCEKHIGPLLERLEGV